MDIKQGAKIEKYFLELEIIYSLDEENIYYVEIEEVSKKGIMRQYGLLQIL